MKRRGTTIRAGISGTRDGGNRSRNHGALFLCILSAFTWLFAGCASAAEGGDPLPSGASGDLKGRVLVAYETSKGSTREIAQVIAAEIRTAGWDAEAVDIKDSPDPGGYSHVIVGGPIYLGKIKGVRGFVDRHQVTLEKRLIGAFAVGMSFAVEDEETRASGRKALDEAIAPLAGAHLGYFAGKIDPEKLSFIQKIMIKVVKSPVGDFRDWDAVKSWAQEIIRAVIRDS